IQPENQFERPLMLSSAAIKPSLLSSEYNLQANINCLLLLMQPMPCALVLALAKAGNNIPARMAMMAITTSSSIKVKPPPRTVSRGRRHDSRFFEVCIRSRGFWVKPRPKLGPSLHRVKCALQGTAEGRQGAHP